MNPGDAHAAEMMNKINAAYDQIKNPQPRTNTQQRQYQDDPFAGWYRQGLSAELGADRPDGGGPAVHLRAGIRAGRCASCRRCPRRSARRSGIILPPSPTRISATAWLGYEQITRACAMDPTNAEYAAAREQIGPQRHGIS